MIQVLLLEDEASDAEVVRRFLSWARKHQYQVTHHETAADGLAALAAKRFDVVLLDLNLADSEESESFHRVHRLAPQVPIVVITGIGSEELGPLLVRKGSQDFLIKGKFDSELLSRSITYAIERQRLLTELERARVLADRERESEILDRIARHSV